jgi:mono/diheme cytochrome c family protein
MNQPLFLSVALAALFSAVVSAQTADKIDFARDVQPIFRQNCVGCHGPTQQLSGFRVDRKSIVLGRRGVVPGSSENSFLFHRITGSAYGTRMPPTGVLKPEQIATLKAWIDQGAEWPDSLSNETERGPLNARAVSIVEGLRSGDFAALDKEATADPTFLNARGPEGSTPFMYAVVYGTADKIELLLQKGADPNAQNDAGATALVWAATDLSKTRELLRHHADVNARSNEMRTPLMVAARKPGNVAVVRLLLDNGANPNPNAHPVTEGSPLTEAGPSAISFLMCKQFLQGIPDLRFVARPDKTHHTIETVLIIPRLDLREPRVCLGDGLRIGSLVNLWCIELEGAQGDRGLSDVIRANRWTTVRRGVGPVAIGHLPVEDVHGRGIGIQVRLIVFGVEPDQDIGNYEYAEVLGWSSYEALTQVVTKLFETKHIGFGLISGNLFVNLEPGPARRADRHGGEAVVVAGCAEVCL